MKISQVLLKTNIKYEANFDDFKISDIALDSRLVKSGSIFFALPGIRNDGKKFIDDAIKNGAALIVSNQKDLAVKNIYCEDVFLLLVEFLQEFYADLPRNIYGVTGTNGKSSVVEFIRQILELLGEKSASIGTLGVVSNCKIAVEKFDLTTPDIVSLYKNLASLKKAKINDVALEASSIGLEQKRLAGIDVGVAAFTNFSQDHLDYHKDMNDYFAAKMILFKDLLSEKGVAILNSDCYDFARVKGFCKGKIIEYGKNSKGLIILGIKNDGLVQRVKFSYDENQYNFTVNISGEFQIFNILCALGCVLAKYPLGESELRDLLAKFESLTPADGRMQRVATLTNDAQIFIDFAHSPDALENVLKMAKKSAKARLLVLFGCGGNRDVTKRPIMGKIACDLADLVIVTDDNPRNEDKSAIRAEILADCNMQKTIEIDDRKIAIQKAIEMLQDNDILVIAGKGHEKYQIIGDKKFDFDEVEIVKSKI